MVALTLAVLSAPYLAGKFNPLAATSYAEESLALRVRRLSDTYSGVKETFLQGVPAVLVLCASVVVVFKSRSWIARALGASAFTLYLTTSMLSGWRSEVVIALLLVGVFFHYRVRPLRWHEIVFGGLGVYAVVNVLSLVRVTSDPRQMLQVLGGEVGNSGYQFLALQRSSELTSSTSLLRLIGGIRSHETTFGFGSIAVGQFIAFLPRFLFENRPNMAGEQFVKIFFPGDFEAGGGYGFFMVGDGYWDFGLVGAFLYCGAYAYGVERAYRALRQRFESDLAVFLYALAYSQLVMGVVRSGIIGSIKGALIAIIPLLLPLVASRIRIQGRVASKVTQGAD
jgi:oligosaccharide repeat unit polymerase